MAYPQAYVPEGLKEGRGWSALKPLHRALEVAQTRLVVVGVLCSLAFIVLTVRLMNVCIFQAGDETLASRGGRVKSHAGVIRANILDRNGEILATSLKTSSLYANAKLIKDPEGAAKKLAKVFPEKDSKKLLAQLKSDKSFVWIARHLTPQLQAEIIRLGIPGLAFQNDERRIYPQGSLFAHVIGFTDVDNRGISGVEKEFNDTLSHTDAVVLSVDSKAQHVLRHELRTGIEKFQADGASGLILNAKTGEVVAMASYPDFDPNQGVKGAAQKDLFNRNTLGVYEMGSTFKIFNTAMVLETNSVQLNQKFDVTQPMRVGRFRITDYHPSDHWMDPIEIFVTSSNIGSAKQALIAGGTKQKAFFETLGFFKPTHLELPETSSPLYPKNWSEATTITASYGYGISVSPLQSAAAVAGILNKGVMMKPTLLKRTEPAQGVRVVSEKTSKLMRGLLYLVVEQGTGSKAKVAGFNVGGKTGTANTVQGKSYKKGENNTSFMAAFPMDDPQYVVFIMVEHPKGIKETYGFNAGGWNAAPMAGQVISKIAPLLGVYPRGADSVSKDNPMVLNVHLGAH